MPSPGHAVILLGALVAATAPLAIGSDGLVRFEMLDALLRGGTLDGRKYSLYGPLTAAPLWYLGEAVGYPRVVVWGFNRIVLLLGVLGLWFALRPVLSERERVRFTALLFLGSMVPWHLMGFFAEVLHLVCVGLGLTLIAVWPGWRARAGWFLAVWGTANAPATAVGLALAALVLCWHRRRWRYLLLPAAAAGLILFENTVRRGDPLEGGYAGEAGNPTVLPYSGQPGFSYPLFFGLLSVLFSFGKGLVFFTPGLFLRNPAEPELPAGSEPLAERAGHTPDREANARLVYWLWLAVVVGLVLVYARWWSWYGGAVWGPRFFLFACLPASLVLARRTAHPDQHTLGANLLTLAAVALSCWVGMNGIVYDQYDHEMFWADGFALEHLTWYVPECSVLWRPFVVHKTLTWAERGYCVAFAVGFAYLVWPVARAAASQLRARATGIGRALRGGPRWRF